MLATGICLVDRQSTPAPGGAGRSRPTVRHGGARARPRAVAGPSRGAGASRSDRCAVRRSRHGPAVRHALRAERRGIARRSGRGGHVLAGHPAQGAAQQVPLCGGRPAAPGLAGDAACHAACDESDARDRPVAGRNARHAAAAVDCCRRPTRPARSPSSPTASASTATARSDARNSRRRIGKPSTSCPVRCQVRGRGHQCRPAGGRWPRQGSRRRSSRSPSGSPAIQLRQPSRRALSRSGRCGGDEHVRAPFAGRRSQPAPAPPAPAELPRQARARPLHLRPLAPATPAQDRRVEALRARTRGSRRRSTTASTRRPRPSCRATN